MPLQALRYGLLRRMLFGYRRGDDAECGRSSDSGGAGSMMADVVRNDPKVVEAYLGHGPGRRKKEMEAAE